MILSDIDKRLISCEAKRFANEMRAKLKISEEEPIKALQLLEEQGYLIFQILNLRASGFVRVLGNEKAIFLNASEPIGRQIYTAIHEYCHILRDLSNVEKIAGLPNEKKQVELEKMEYFASQFADYFLMSEVALLSYLSNQDIKDFSKISIKEVMAIQHYFQLSYRQTTRMLNKYGILTKSQRDEFNKISTKDEPELLREKTKQLGFDVNLISPLQESCIPERFEKSIHDNIKNGRITRKKVMYLADLLQMPSLENLIETGNN